MPTAINTTTLKSEQFVKAYDKVESDPTDILNEFQQKVATSQTLQLLTTGKTVQVLEPSDMGNPNAPKYKDEDLKPVNMKRFPFETTITQGELGKLVVSDGKLSPKKLAQTTNEHMTNHKDNRQGTRAHSCYGAIKGKVVSGKGTTLVDFYELFDLKRHEVTLNVFDPQADLPKLMMDLYTHIEKQCDESGIDYKGFKVRIDRDSIRLIVGHPKVLENGGEAAKARLMTFENNPKKAIDIYGFTFIPDNAKQVKSDGAVYPEVKRGFLSMHNYVPPLMGKQKEAGDGSVVSLNYGKHDEYVNILSFSHDMAVCRDPSLLAGLKIVKVDPAA